MSTLDEAILLVYPQRMLHGDLPFHDFFAAYGPTFWWGLEGWYGAFGLTLLAMRLLGLTLHVLLALGVYRVLLPTGRAVAWTGAALTGVLLFRLGANPYAWLVATTLCIWQLALLRQPVTRRRTVVAGLLAGLAVGVRPDTALLALLAPVPLLRGRHDVRAWAGGLGAGLIPLAAGLALTGSAMLDQILLGRAGRGASQSRLAFLPHDAPDRRLLAVLLAVVLLTVVTALRGRQPHQVAFALLAVFALPQAFQRADYTHFVYAGLLCLTLLPSTLADLYDGLPRPPLRPAALGALTAVAAFLIAVPEVPRNLVDLVAHGNMQAVLVHHDGRTLPEAPLRAAVLDRVLPVVDAVSRPGQTVFVFDADLVRPAVDDVSLYYLLPRLRQRAFHMEITPGVTNAPGSGLLQDVRDADVLILLHTSAQEHATLFPYERKGSPAAQEAVAELFCRRARIDVYEVLTRCA